MLIVEHVVLETIRMRLKQAFRISSGSQEERCVVLVRLVTKDGTGVGECVAGDEPNYSYETTETARWMMERHLCGAILGLEFPGARELAMALTRAIRGHPMARAALEMAAWHLEAQQRGVSLASLLGGSKDRIEVGVSIGLQPSVEELLTEIQRYVDQGYRRVKLKIAPGHDLEFVRHAREAFPELAMQVDANAAYGASDMAHLRRFDPLGLLMIEQPFAEDDLVTHAKLQAMTETPVCLDESIGSAAECESALALQAAGVVNIKPGRVGGFAEAIRIHDLCADAGVPVWCGGMLETGIGRAHNLALASLPNFRYPADLSASDRYWDRDVVDPPFTLEPDGTILVPGRTGLGVDIDERLLDTIREDHMTIECQY
ncbi:MAG TPA: o-succinylbenzoate synthase [Longimicrobiales bacterium]|nr:o-succinylbenzoate synthase [Longimicrobiales bacterium]